MESNDLIKKQVQSNELTTEQKEIVDFSISRSFTMPKFKAENFVGQAQITPYGAMKQYLLEVQGRQHGIMNTEYEIEKLELQIEEQEHNLSNTEGTFEKRACEIEIKHLKNLLGGQLRNLRGQQNERQMYIELIEQLDKSEYGTLPDGTKLIDAFDEPGKLEELERDYWIKRLGKQAAMDMIAYGKVGVGNMDSIVMLNKKDQEMALAMASDVFVKNENRLVGMVKKANENNQIGVSSELSDQLRITVQDIKK